jgi:hypothetical protein
VNFPYEAYDCQKIYMEKVIQALQDVCTTTRSQGFIEFREIMHCSKVRLELVKPYVSYVQLSLGEKIT